MGSATLLRARSCRFTLLMLGTGWLAFASTQSSRTVFATPLSVDFNNSDPCAEYARSMVDRMPGEIPVTMKIDAALGGREAFKIDRSPAKIVLTGGGPAGLLYGAQTLRADP